jgi:hypothetical protein
MPPEDRDTLPPAVRRFFEPGVVMAIIGILTFVGTIAGGVIAVRDGLSGAISKIEQKNESQDQRITDLGAAQKAGHDEEQDFRRSVGVKLDAQTQDLGKVLARIEGIASTMAAVQAQQLQLWQEHFPQAARRR